MTPLERSARALCSLDGHPENAKMDGKPLWQDYLPEARAALTAIREPSDLMGLALLKMGGEYRSGSHSATQIWRTMIDAALMEEPPPPPERTRAAQPGQFQTKVVM